MYCSRYWKHKTKKTDKVPALTSIFTWDHGGKKANTNKPGFLNLSMMDILGRIIPFL